jgi:uncharacterized protein with von Willebrand factor type A (vWA) domain
VRALDAVGVSERVDVYWALRQTLTSGRSDLDPFDDAFAAWFDRAEQPARDPAGDAIRLVEGDEAAEGEDGGEERGFSFEEAIRRKPFPALTHAERAEVRRLISLLPGRRPLRRSRRRRPHRAGRELDLRALARGALATGGEPIERSFLRRRLVPRKVVLLCDVSGSMEAFARPLLFFGHVLLRAGPNVEVFAFGTRLTRLTPELGRRDVEAVLGELTSRELDWSGGTRIGESLRRFNDDWGRRGIGRGAVVVVVSDGWERGDVDSVAREMGRLARAAYSVIWVNPHRSSPGYEPLAAGMRAALPYVDRFVAGANLEDLERLADAVASVAHRHAVGGGPTPRVV